MQVSGKFEKKTVKANYHQIDCKIKTSEEQEGRPEGNKKLKLLKLKL